MDLPWIVFLVPSFMVPPRGTVCVIDAPGSFHPSSPRPPKWLHKTDVRWGLSRVTYLCYAKWQESVFVIAINALPLIQSPAGITDCWRKIFSVESCEWLGGAKVSSFSSDWGDREGHSCLHWLAFCFCLERIQECSWGIWKSEQPFTYVKNYLIKQLYWETLQYSLVPWNSLIMYCS